MMKRLLLLVCLFIGISSIAVSQEFKHFKVKMFEHNWQLIREQNKPMGEEILISIPDGSNKVLLFNAIHSFPEEIKKELIKCKRINLFFTFNSKGEVKCQMFMGAKVDGFSLTEKQWLDVVRIMENVKLDVNKLKILPSELHRPEIIKSELSKLKVDWYGSMTSINITKILRGELYLDSNGKICTKGKK